MDISVETTSPVYLRHMESFREVRIFYAPMIKIYFDLPEDGKRAWRRRDPLLSDLLEFSEKVSGEKNIE